MPRFSANLSTMFAATDSLDRFARAAEAGFPAVEIQFPYTVPAPELAAAAARAGTPIVMINTPVADSLPGLAGTPGYESRFRSGLAQAAEYARVLGVRYVNVLAGVQRRGAEVSSCRRQLRRSLEYAAGVLGEHGIGVLLEAVNRSDVPGYLVPDIDDAAALVAECDSGNLGLLFDVYHAARAGIDIRHALREHLDAIDHVQFADCPGRHEPGTGNVPFDAVFTALDELGYAGWAGAEYVPLADIRGRPAWMRRYGG